MRYLSLFSGIEAATCAWQHIPGWELIGLSEIEKFPCNVLSKHYPNVPNLGDVTKITKADLAKLGQIDLIVGGSPCLGGNVLVLTNHGWKPIVHITMEDKLWDGEQYVTHHGVIYKGTKQIIHVDGIQMTPNHLLYFPKHDTWREAGDWFKDTTDDDRLAMAMMEDTWSYLPMDYRTPEYNARGTMIGITRDTAKGIEVYDILDVGEHNRFMIRTTHGVLLAHNCQGFSVAGKQGGLNDIRSKLAINYIGIINAIKPKWIVWENVPGVFSTNKGLDFRLFTGALARIGYGICWRVLDAQYFGVAQRRRRVFLVGYLGDWRPAAEVLFERQSLPGYLETLARTKERLAESAKGRSGKTSSCLNPWSEQSKRVLRTDGVCDCLCASEKMKSITKILDDRTCVNSWDPQGKRISLPEQKAPCLSASADAGGNTLPLVYDMNHPCDVIRTYEDGKTPTLEARMGTGGNNIPLVTTHKEVIGLGHTGKFAEDIKDKCPTLMARQYKDPPIILDDQGGSVMNVSVDGKVGTLRAETHNHQPIVTESYRIGAYHSEGMKSDNPHSGIYRTETSNTLDASDPTPACQQGGIAVVSSAAFKPEQGAAARGIGWKDEQSPTLTGTTPAVCVQGSVIGRKPENGPQGDGVNIEKSFTLNTTDRHAVATHARVRKLTPTECLRLQGFPDDWFDGVEGYSDTAAYKAIGNSMAVPCMRWIGEQIQSTLLKANGDSFGVDK